MFEEGLEKYALKDRDELTEVAMEIIIHAGEADRIIHEVLDDLASKSLEGIKDKIKEAKEEIRLSHVAQTGVLHKEAEGKVYIPSVLFIHAQDTLMTVNNTVNLVEKMFIIIENNYA